MERRSRGWPGRLRHCAMHTPAVPALLLPLLGLACGWLLAEVPGAAARQASAFTRELVSRSQPQFRRAMSSASDAAAATAGQPRAIMRDGGIKQEPLKSFAGEECRRWVGPQSQTPQQQRGSLRRFMQEAHGLTMAALANKTKGLARFDIFQVTVGCPPSRPLTKYGGFMEPRPNGTFLEDGQKYLCDVTESGAPPVGAPASTSAPDCIIVSLGSNGDYSFEEAMLNSTGCHVHTFDCSYDKGKSIHTRHTFHKVCIGPTDEALVAEFGGKKFRKSETTTHKPWSVVAREINPGNLPIAVLKCDIEGGEYLMVSELAASGAPLPRQLSMEVHLMPPWSLLHVSSLHVHLASIGYALISRDDNANSHIRSDGQEVSVTEYSWILVKQRRNGGQARRGGAAAPIRRNSAL